MNEALIVAVRGIIGFFTLLIFARILGKQQVSQFTFFEYVLGITIGSTASTLTTDLTSEAWPHWVGLLVWIAAGLLMQWITLKWRYASKYIEGEPAIVIMEGKIMEDVLKKMRFRVSDLLELLREKDVFDISEVEYAILESDGQLSVLKKQQYQSVKAKDLNIIGSEAGLSIELIYDGNIVKQNLEQVNKDEKWLMDQIKMKGVSSIEDVFLATIAPSGKLYVDTYKDRLKKLIDIGDYNGPY